jgi:hypothetical protein
MKGENEHMQKTPIRENWNAKKLVRSQEQSYAHNKSKLHFAIFRGGGAKTDPHFGTTY